MEKDIVVYDFDGPRNPDGCDEVSVDLLREKIEDTRFPFGHGYIVAGLLAGIEPYMYTWNWNTYCVVVGDGSFLP